MKSVVKISGITNSKDVAKIQSAIAYNEGVMACQVSIDKKEAIIVYNEEFITLEDLIDSIENVGYIVF